MANRFIQTFPVTVSDGSRLDRVTDEIITEIPLDILLNGLHMITIACTGHHPEELAAGYLRAEDLITSRHDIADLRVSEDGTTVSVTTPESASPAGERAKGSLSLMSSGARKKRKDEIAAPITRRLTVRTGHILSLMEALLAASILHETTHGTHCSALADGNGLIVFRDDIGRHNTIDMLGGYTLFADIDCGDKYLLTTGRISTEIASKAYNLGIPVVISHAVPTSRAVLFGRDAGMTLIGYVRQRRMKIYTHEERVTR